VSHRFAFTSLLVILGLGSTVLPALSQVVPHVLQLDSTQLEKTGAALAQEAAQLAQFQQLELALARAQLATQLAPQTYQAWAILGVLSLEAQQPQQAIVALERARSLSRNDPKALPNVLFSLGNAYFQQSNYPAAVRELQAGLALKPNTPDALFDLGNAYYKLQRFQDAIAQYSKAIAQDKQFWPAINNIGLVKYETGDIATAIRQWQSAIAIDAKASEPKLALAVALYTQGRQDQGLALAETALKLDGSYASVDFLKENLWGDRLLTDTKKMLAAPRLQATIAQIEALKRRFPQRPR